MIWEWLNQPLTIGGLLGFMVGFHILGPMATGFLRAINDRLERRRRP